MTAATETIAGKRVLFVMAVDAEYGPNLKALLTPLFTGVGPVEAGVATARALAELEATGGLPNLVVCLGSAGSRTLEQTSVYQVTSVTYRDMDASILGFEKGVTPFLDLPAMLDLPLRIPGIPGATLATGASVVSGAAYATIGAEMVDMETFAVARAAMGHNIPLIGLRGISDGDAELGHIDDWTQYLHVVDQNLAEAVTAMASALADGRLTLPHQA